MMIARSLTAAAVLVGLFSAAALAPVWLEANDTPGDSPRPAEKTASTKVDFERDIRPILAEHCLACHGPDQARSGLRLSDGLAAFEPAGSGEPAIVRGDAESSELIRRVLSDDPRQRMPAEADPLGDEEIELLRQWIDAGAAWAEHWAFRPIERPDPPAVSQHADRVRNPIDAFVLAKLEQKGVDPSPEADRYTLIRRLYYDLIGLPPAPEQVDAFVHDDSPQAYERVVDELLGSLQFGERWGRHWLDKARYADSDGYEKDNPRPDAYMYRDWVIRAVNDDMPMDRFTIEQLAGDLLEDATDDQHLATALHRQTLTNTEGGTDQEEFRVAAVVDRTNTTGAIWLGLTVGCAECHTHKYDQLTHEEYFGLYAFFNSWDETTRRMPGFAAEITQYEDVADEDAKPAEGEAEESMIDARVLAERDQPRQTRIHERGDFLAPADPVERHTPAVLHELQPRDPEREPDRLDLAHWLMDEKNPLTPRVLANHVWLRLFGEGLVTTVDDFGVRGERPSHPDLLDWLASEYRKLGWSRKAMIRLIVTSSTYRQQSAHRSDMVDLDPLNRLLYLQNRFRVDGELVRDITLAASGLLSEKVGGPSVFPPMPPEIAALSYANNFQWSTSDGEDRYRRGMYTFFKRTAPYPELIAFDCPDANTATLQRRRSNTPMQALTLLNNEVYVEAAQAFARRLLQEADTDETRLARAVRLAIARPPTEAELDWLTQLLEASRDYYANADMAEAQKMAGDPGAGLAPALETYGDDYTEAGAAEAEQGANNPAPLEDAKLSPAHAAELAAWTATARIVLNLDEFLTRP